MSAGTVAGELPGLQQQPRTLGVAVEEGNRSATTFPGGNCDARERSLLRQRLDAQSTRAMSSAIRSVTGETEERHS